MSRLVVLAMSVFVTLLPFSVSAAVTPKIATGNRHSVSLASDGTVKAWGGNESGQLGDGTNTDSSTPVTVTGLGGNVTDVFAGPYHTVALLSNGTVKAWGNNYDGQLGDGSNNSSSTPVSVADLGGVVTSIAVGTLHTVTLMSDGTVKAWGANWAGQLGDGTTTDSSTPVTVTGLGGKVIAIASGDAHTIALMSDGTLRAWGSNGFGQLGDGTATDSSLPVTVSGLGGKVIAISAGDYHTIVLMSDGTVKTWGYNGDGALGDGTCNNSSTPVAVSVLGDTATAVAAGNFHSLALMSDGTVKAWGNNEYGQLGDGTRHSSTTPVTASFLTGTVTAIAAREFHSLALMSDGSVMGWGNNRNGQLGNGTTSISKVPVSVTGLDGTVMGIASGDYHTVALMSDGTVNAWGDNGLGQLGDGTLTTRATPVTVVGLDGSVTVIAAGNSHTLALMSNGETKAWGGNWIGQLGNGSNSISSPPVTVTGLGGTATSLAAGFFHTVALMSDGTVMAWGDNSVGQLGDGTTTDSSIPVAVTGLGGTVTAIAAGSLHTVALMSDGTVKAWGENEYGQLGDGTNTDSSLPVTVSGLGGKAAIAIAAGQYYTVALMSDGTVKAWGANWNGQLGNGTTENRSIPVSVTGLGGTVTSIAAGYSHTVALMSNGTVKAWGRNEDGQLGDGTTMYRPTPVTVTGLAGTVAAIAAGLRHTVALMTGGTVKAWGGDWSGQLGDGNPMGFPTAALTNLDVSPPDTGNDLLSGHYSVSQVLHLSCSDNFSGCAGIWYTIDGSDPTYPPTGSTQTYGNHITIGSSMTLKYFSRDTAGNSEPVRSSSYVIDTVTPTITFSGLALSNDTGTSSTDFITNVAGQTITAVLSEGLSSGDTVYGSLDNGSSWSDITAMVSGTTLTWGGATLSGSNVIKLTVMNSIGNDGPVASQAYILDSTAPELIISALADGSTTAIQVLNVAGSASDSSGLASLTLNGTDILTNAAGFSLPVQLVSGANAITVAATDSAGNSASETRTITYDPSAPALTLNFAGTGDGSVSGDISCTSAGSCPAAEFTVNTLVTLIPLADSRSTFTGWSGACTNTSGNCSITMNSAKSVTATFDAAPMAKVGTKDFSTIQGAYNDASTQNSSVIKLLEGTSVESINFARSISIFLTGGYNAAFSGIATETNVKGRVNIRSGTIRARNVNIR